MRGRAAGPSPALELEPSAILMVEQLLRLVGARIPKSEAGHCVCPNIFSKVNPACTWLVCCVSEAIGHPTTYVGSKDDTGVVAGCCVLLDKALAAVQEEVFHADPALSLHRGVLQGLVECVSEQDNV